MNLDILLIKLFLQDTTLWLKFGKFVNTKSNNLYTKIYHALSRLKDGGNGTSHTVVDLVAKFHTLYPVVSPQEQEAFEHVSQALLAAEVEPSQTSELLERLRDRSVASEVALLAVEVASGEKEFGELLDFTQKLDSEDIHEEDESDFVPDDFVVVSDKYQAETPFKFRLQTLNAILGGLRRRTFGFIFARPEMGKTQLIASEATYLAQQVESCVLWVNNEEDGLALITRCYQSALGLPNDKLFSDPAAARDKYNSIIQGRVKIYDKPTATARDIESVIRDKNPDIVFIDQLDKVKGIDGERYDLKQKALYQWAREIAKRYNCAVVGICQAGGTAEGKKYLDMNDVDSSHTAKQGEADWMCGMGMSNNVGDEDKRYLSFCKNKLQVTPLMKTNMRHAKVPIRSVPELQLYEDVLHV